MTETLAVCPRCFANIRARFVALLGTVVTECDCPPGEPDEPQVRAHTAAADWFRRHGPAER